MKDFDVLAKSVLVLFTAITLLCIFPESLQVISLAKSYPSVFHNSRSSSQYNNVNPSFFFPSRFHVGFKLHNVTGMVSLVGQIDVNSLQAHKFKPFVFTGSSASFLTKDYAAYKTAKNASEALRPATKVFQIHTLSSSTNNSIFNKNQFDHSRPNQTRKSSWLKVQFKGLEQNCCIPPDVQLAAGPNYVMEMVNLDGAIYTKGGSLVREFGLEQFFNPIKTGGGLSSSASDNNMSDPILLFDSQSDRWFASISDETEHSIRVAVSQTADPTGIWRVYNFPFGSQYDNNCSDQPFIGVSEDKFVLTVNNWANNCNWYSDNRPPEFRGVQFTIANKTEILAGSNIVEFRQSESNMNYFSLHTVTALSPISGLLITTVGDFGRNILQVFYIDGPVSNLRIRLLSVTIQTSHVPPDGIQPAAAFPSYLDQSNVPRVSTGDSRIQSAIWYHGMLWLAFNDGCYLNNDTKSRSCIRFIQLNTSTDDITQDFDIAAFASSLYYSALSVNKAGNLGIIFGYSSYSRNPSLLISKHLSSDLSDSIEEPQILKLGTSNELSDRYGDYFAASPDPSNGSAIWIAGEYHEVATWSTYIAQLHIWNNTTFGVSMTP
jgi:hypothetical protein